MSVIDRTVLRRAIIIVVVTLGSSVKSCRAAPVQPQSTITSQEWDRQLIQELNWSDGEFGGWNGRQMWELGGSEPCQGTSCPVCITECKVCAGREWKDGEPPSTSCGLDAIDTKFLGGPRCAGKDSTLFKKFDLSGVPHAKLLISFEYVYFNTWDGTQSSDGDEVARMTVVGGPVWTSTPKQHKTGEHIYAFDPKSNDECRHRESYGTERVEDWVVDHDGDEVTIEFGASLNQVVSDEAFGLSWFRLEAVAGPAPSSVPSATPSAAPTAVPSATPVSPTLCDFGHYRKCKNAGCVWFPKRWGIQGGCFPFTSCDAYDGQKVKCKKLSYLGCKWRNRLDKCHTLG